METAPRLELEPDASLPLHAIVVTAHHEGTSSRATQMMKPIEANSAPYQARAIRS